MESISVTIKTQIGDVISEGTIKHEFDNSPTLEQFDRCIDFLIAKAREALKGDAQE